MRIWKGYISVDPNLRQRNTDNQGILREGKKFILPRMNFKFNISILIFGPQINGNGSHMLSRVGCTEKKYIYIHIYINLYMY